MKKLLNIALWALLLGPLTGIVSACSEEDDCTLATRAMMNCRLYTIDELTGLTVKDTLDWLTITAEGTDSVILNRQEDVKELTLPLRYTADSTVMILHYDPERPVTDTLVIYHRNTPYFLSMDCGYQMKQSIEAIRYSRYVLDSIYIANPEAGIYGTENIQLFY